MSSTSAQVDAAGPPAVRRIEPAHKRVRLRDIRATWPVSKVLAARDLSLRQKQALLGPLWHLIQPLGIVAGFLFLFNGVTQVDTGSTPYLLFALVGMTVYGYIQLTLGFGVRTHLQSYRLIKRVACPRLPLIHASMLASLIQPALMLVIIAVAILIEGVGLTPNIIAFPLCAAWLLLAMWVTMLLLPTLNVRWRDISLLTPLVLQAGLFLSPVGYPVSATPGALYWAVAANPVTGIMEAWRWSLLGSSVDVVPILFAAGWTVAIGVLGWQLFTRWEVKFADII